MFVQYTVSGNGDVRDYSCINVFILKWYTVLSGWMDGVEAGVLKLACGVCSTSI